MKHLTITLTALVMSLGLATSAQAATNKAKKCTCQTVAKKAVAKKSVSKKAVKKTTATKAKATTRMSQEVNPNIPADLRINQTSNVADVPERATATTYTASPRVVPTAVTVPVTRVVQTAPATQVTHVEPVDGDTVKRTVTTTVPVAVETTPVVVPVVTTP